MNRKTFTLTFAIGVTLAVPAFSFMHYKVTIAGPVVPIQFPPPPPTEFATCQSDSDTLAVGMDTFAAGVRVLCADAGRIGFWTTFTPSSSVGTQSNPFTRRLCPSGTALSGIHHGVNGDSEPICSILVPNFTTGAVARFSVTTINELPPSVGDFICPVNEFFQGFRSIGGATPTPICAQVLTDARGDDSPVLDVAIRTLSQRAIMGRNDSENFNIE